jgi:rhodanese-related sulfurtransferase
VAANSSSDRTSKDSTEPISECDPATLEEHEICLRNVPGDALWIAARSRAEWEKNSLDGSLLWNLDPKENQQHFEAQAAMKVLESDFVVVFCGSQACGTSHQIAKRIRQLDLGPPVKVLHGGWEALQTGFSGKN